MTEGWTGGPDPTGPSGSDGDGHRVDAGDRLRRTNRTVLLGAAAVVVVIGIVGAAGGGGGGAALLILGGIGLAAVALVRDRNGTSTGPRATPASSDTTATDDDIAKASTLSTGDLSIEEICRLTRPGYSWWPDGHKAAFRESLARRLDL